MARRWNGQRWVTEESREFISALCEGREPAVDLYEALAMTMPGIIAHESAFKGGEQVKVPSFDKV